MTIVELTQLIMRQERMGWSRAMLEAIQRREAGERRRAEERERARQRRQARRQERGHAAAEEW